MLGRKTGKERKFQALRKPNGVKRIRLDFEAGV
jgi:hypothetical protein